MLFKSSTMRRLSSQSHCITNMRPFYWYGRPDRLERASCAGMRKVSVLFDCCHPSCIMSKEELNGLVFEEYSMILLRDHTVRLKRMVEVWKSPRMVARLFLAQRQNLIRLWTILWWPSIIWRALSNKAAEAAQSTVTLFLFMQNSKTKNRSMIFCAHTFRPQWLHQMQRSSRS